MCAAVPARADGDGRPAQPARRFVRPSPFKLTAFQAGKRLCLGLDMAYLEAKIVAVMLLRRFDFTLAPGQGDITYARSLTLPMARPLAMRVTRR